jgi:mannose/fructose/N-acetylgalactosamine-specific phosphotransferase system component IID
MMSNKLTKKDINSAMIRSMMYQWKSFNYETMQSPGFTAFILPSLKKIYAGDEELIKEKTTKYLSTFYNTENTMGQIIHGAALALEESGKDGITDTTIALRTGLMGHLLDLEILYLKYQLRLFLGH